MKTLAGTLGKAVVTRPATLSELLSWVSSFPTQSVILSTQIAWAEGVEYAIRAEASVSTALQTVLIGLEDKLKVLSESVLLDLCGELRKKCEQVITHF